MTNGRAHTTYLRWAGGKQRLISRLLPFTPTQLSGAYYEPFLGAGSMFFALAPERGVLSDLNGHLVRSFMFVRDRPELVAQYLRSHAANSSKEHYYRVRETYNRNRRSLSATQAARFIYLNRTCFNGIFRVNQKSEFNVPYGRIERPILPTAAELERASLLLKKVELRTSRFEDSVQNAAEGDFVYLDPPYPPLNGTAFFRHYTPGRFTAEDQERVARVAQELSARGCSVMMSNADTPFIRDLYSDFNISGLQVTRFVTCKARKLPVSELVITNYEVATDG